MNHRDVSRVKSLILIACAGALCGAAMPAEREAPLTTMSVPGGQVTLGRPRVLDAIDGGRTIIRSMAFDLEEGEIPDGALLTIRIEGPGGLVIDRAVRPSAGNGAGISVPIDVLIPPERQGLLLTKVRVSLEETILFYGLYMLGYPRYETSRDLRKIEEGALLRDDFEGPGPDEGLWIVKRSQPESSRVEQRDGRAWVRVTGATSYNGLTSRDHADSRDLVAVCRTGIRSEEGANHLAILHVCGSGRLSPDHWFEVALGDPDGTRASASLNVSVPAPLKESGDLGRYMLPSPASEGYLVKIECRGEDNTCSGFVRVEDEWWPIGNPHEVPARETKLEIKTGGFTETLGRSSSAWFDDCRLYPRPETHYVSVLLRAADGGRLGNAAPDVRPVCFSPGNQALAGCGYTIKLLDPDGVTVIDETETSAGYGWGLLSLRSARWDPYPASAIIRIEAGGRRIGPDHLIESEGVEGLYPDDVYAVTLE